MRKPEYRIVSFSGGKDSTAMLLRMIEEGIRFDCILFCDTGLEFPAMYRHIDRVEKAIGMKITRVKNPDSYEYLMFDAPIDRTKNKKFIELFGLQAKGYGWPGPRMRWCTSRLKDKPREAFLKPMREKYEVIEYVGIAADEEYRLKRERNKNENHRHPLVEWKMTEADCLKYCYEKGFDWEGLYTHFRRVSCWCCPLQSLPELRSLYEYYPELWNTLKNWESRTWRKFRRDYSVFELEIRFELEKEYLRSDRSITSRAFFIDLRQLLMEVADGKSK